ncbi:mitochondrial small ribosomal subunit Rsm22-domain-containing protein [Dipodascopsis tothii]|uniref:mitochondrial small ribosomal subunit Rsm22-domain-containing protein n=1 Tax=Dipodascopsis tothii TaxID=44089 RepID=UPI0034CF90AA
MHRIVSKLSSIDRPQSARGRSDAAASRQHDAEVEGDTYTRVMGEVMDTSAGAALHNSGQVSDADLAGLGDDYEIEFQRYDPQTLAGRSAAAHSLEIPGPLNEAMAEIIAGNNVGELKTSIRDIYQRLQDTNSRKATVPGDVDAQLAAFFARDYAALHHVLQEVRKRGGDWAPRRVLDVSYSVGVGLLAMADVFGSPAAPFRPEVQDVVVFGSKKLMKRGRQLHRAAGTDDERLRFMSQLPGRSRFGKYDMVVVNQILLESEVADPGQIAELVMELQSYVAPGGVLVVAERGRPAAFETVAHAREVLIRPKSIRPSRMSAAAVLRRYVPDETGVIAEDALARSTANELYATPDGYTFARDEVMKRSGRAFFVGSWKVVAPCAHHGHCPLQLGSFDGGDRKHRHWCHFGQKVQRPPWLATLKSGKKLAGRWDDDDASGEHLNNKGRVGSKNFEVATFSYVVARRAPENYYPEFVEVEEGAEEGAEEGGELAGAADALAAAAAVTADPLPAAPPAPRWPRIVMPPLKRSGHVVMDMCSSRGLIERWIVPRSYSRVAYHDARKASWGDEWALGAKTKVYKHYGSKEPVPKTKQQKRDERRQQRQQRPAEFRV